MKLALLIRITALIVALFSLISLGTKVASIHQQSVQEAQYQAWASDEAILTRTLAEFEAMRKLVSLYAATRDPKYINHYLDLVGIHNGSRVYSEPVGNDYWIDVITGQRKVSAVTWGVGDNLNERLYSLKFVQPEEPAIERILDLKHQLEKSELNAFAQGMNRYVGKDGKHDLTGEDVKDTFGVLFDRKHIELTHALTFEISALIAREKRRYLTQIESSRSELKTSVVVDAVLTLLFIVGLCAGLLAIKRRVIDPINSLYSASEEIMKGDYTVRVTNHQGTQEIILLTRAFNRMIRSFQRDLEKSERVKRALEEVNLANLEKERAKNESRIKSSFLANMSHEIRTPMNAILGMTALTLKTNLSEKQRDYLKKIQLSGNNLLALINSILDLSKLESDMFKLEQSPFRFDDVLEEVFGTLGNTASHKNIRLHYTLKSRNMQSMLNNLVGDPLRIGQIFKNLVGNAIKFTQRGYVSVSAKILERQDDQVTLQFSVSDTGIGMSKDKLQNVFDKFTQADSSTTRMYGGSGLGLSIAKELVHLMGGDIHVQSTLGKGSVFNFTLKLRLQEGVPLTLRSPMVNTDTHVYLCSEDGKLLKSMRSLFVEFGVQLTAVTAQQIIWQDIHTTDNDLIVVDCDVTPHGMETFAELISLSRTHPSQWVWLSTQDSAEVLRTHPMLTEQKILTTPLLPRHVIQMLDLDPKTVEGEAHEVSPALTQLPTGGQFRHADLLLVEDHPLNMELLIDFLAPRKYNIQCARDGQEAMDLLKQRNRPFDMIITDLEMPLLDGYQLAAWIRSHLIHGQTPIMALTAHAFEQTRVRCTQLGIDMVLTKPFHEADLYNAVRNALARQDGVLTGFEQCAAEAPGNPSTKSQAGRQIFQTDRFEPQRMAKYLSKFIETSHDLVPRLNQLLKDQAYAEFRREIHSTSGVLGMLAKDDIKAAFSQMDRDLEDPAQTQRVMREVHEQWPAILAEARETLDRMQKIGQT
ncbi:ATP-binding protein [Limnobacter humi]|uniref:histidine kinase n=1 Tax=Limnobacter humi TaxID=1778671 RepID=A0ABT1WDR5_9BURK|nr:ATP-binding protein [Limnobacter humi]MCQ8895640.1 ATP-binding protein [Limnobacter humi]